MAQEHILIVTLLPLCLVLVGASVGLMIGACINNKKYKHIMDTQQEIIDALNAAKATIVIQSENIAVLNSGVKKIGTETDGLKESVRLLTEALGNQNAPSQELKDAVAGVVAAVASSSDSIAALATSVAEGDAKVDDAPSA